MLSKLHKTLLARKGYQPDTPWGPWTALLAAAFVLFSPGLIVFSYFEVLFFSEESFARAILLIDVVTALLIYALVLPGRGTVQGVLADHSLRHLALGAFVGVLTVFALGTLLDVTHLIVFPEIAARDFKESCEIMPPKDYWTISVLTLVVFAPLNEELIFRGFLFSALSRPKGSFWMPALVTSGIWALLHTQYHWSYLPLLFCNGIMLSWLLWRCGNIWLCVACHALWNLVAVIYLRDCIF